MTSITIKVTKNNNSDNVTVNQTANGNVTITGDIYAASDVIVNTRTGLQDASSVITGSLGVAIFSEADEAILAKTIKATGAYYAKNAKAGDKFPFVGLVITASSVRPTPTGSVLISGISKITLERPEEVVDLAAFKAVSNEQQTKRHLSWAEKMMNVLGRVNTTA